MESMKHKLGILAVVLCFLMIIAVVWYCLFGLKDGSNMMKGTLVSSPVVAGSMVKL